LVWNKDQFKPETDLERLCEFDVVINCIGKSDTRWCESHFEEAFYSNALTVRALSNYCKVKKLKFVHVSTGCLYDGSNENIDNTENDFIAAHCNYVITKWAAEKFCNPMDLIVRPRLLFGTEPCNKNLLCRLPKYKKFTSDVLDSITSTDILVDATISLLYAGQFGVFNVACEGPISMYNIAELIGIDSPKPAKAREIIEQECLYLVNNRMSIEKLRKFYTPPTAVSEILRCYEELQCNSSQDK
jgi:dTDP-4-dehydrorhamnose reductase